MSLPATVPLVIIYVFLQLIVFCKYFLEKNAEVLDIIACPFWTMLQRSPDSHLTAGSHCRH